MAELTGIPDKPYLSWRDFATLFACGRSKALLLMHRVGVVYIGHSVFVRREELQNHLTEHGGIDITWPRKRPNAIRSNHGRKD